MTCSFDKGKLTSVASEIIDWREKDLTELTPNMFEHFMNLRNLLLAKNKLTTIPDNIFSNNEKIDKLALGYNNITNIEENAFSGLNSITQIFLPHNNIKELKPNIFKSLLNLEHILLNNNFLVEIPCGLFANNPKLKKVNFEHNDIKIIGQNTFNPSIVADVAFIGNECIDENYNQTNMAIAYETCIENTICKKFQCANDVKEENLLKSYLTDPQKRKEDCQYLKPDVCEDLNVFEKDAKIKAEEDLINRMEMILNNQTKLTISDSPEHDLLKKILQERETNKEIYEIFNESETSIKTFRRNDLPNDSNNFKNKAERLKDIAKEIRTLTNYIRNPKTFKSCENFKDDEIKPICDIIKANENFIKLIDEMLKEPKTVESSQPNFEKAKEDIKIKIENLKKFEDNFSNLTQILDTSNNVNCDSIVDNTVKNLCIEFNQFKADKQANDKYIASINDLLKNAENDEFTQARTDGVKEEIKSSIESLKNDKEKFEDLMKVIDKKYEETGGNSNFKEDEKLKKVLENVQSIAKKEAVSQIMNEKNERESYPSILLLVIAVLVIYIPISICLMCKLNHRVSDTSYIENSIFRNEEPVYANSPISGTLNSGTNPNETTQAEPKTEGDLIYLDLIFPPGPYKNSISTLDKTEYATIVSKQSK